MNKGPQNESHAKNQKKTLKSTKMVNCLGSNRGKFLYFPLKLRVSGMYRFFVIVLLTTVVLPLAATSQAVYNNCNEALELCPGQVFSVSNIDANKTLCPGCEDDFTFCFTPNNTIWLVFTTNPIGGVVTVDFSSLVFEAGAGMGTSLQASLLSATVPCNSASYTQIGNCESNGSATFTLTAPGLAPSTTYYVVISGSNTGAGVTLPAECTFNVSVSGAGVDRIQPQLNISLSEAQICKNELLTATALLTDCPEEQEYNWFINGSLVAVTNTPQFISSELNDGDVISVETACYTDCPIALNSTSSAVSVTTISVDAGPDITIDYGDTVPLNGSSSSTNFSWSPSFLTSNSNVIDPYVWPLQTTVFTLTATDGDCVLSDQVIVYVEPQLIIPNTFSPNDDGSNDSWIILGIEMYPDCFVRIYDRWGQEVYNSSGYSASKAWDGTSRSGGKLSEGVYFYILELRDDEKQQFKGSISLIR